MRTVPMSSGLRKGAWTEEEDVLLRNTVAKFGEGKWHRIPDRAGLNRCRKSCRLRWLNYLKPDIKRGDFSYDEVDLIVRLHKLLGNRWSLIAGRLPGRTANDVKNYWNTHLFKKLLAGKISEPKLLRPAKTNTTTRPKAKLAKNAHVVVKPKPRFFSKEKPLMISAAAEDAPYIPVKDVSPPAPAQDPATPVMQTDFQYNCTGANNSGMQYWWDDLLAGDDNIQASSPPDNDFMRLFSDGSESNQEVGGCGFTVFPPESELWDFLFSDNN